MNQEITLTSSRALQTSSDDLWAQGTSLSAAGAKQQPFKKVQRLLRGRMWLAVGDSQRALFLANSPAQTNAQTDSMSR